MPHAWEQRSEAIVAASVEEVWAAIATGPGIDSWFMGRSQVAPGPDGSVTTDVGGFAMTSAVTGWNPPNHFTYRNEGPGDRFIAFEYLIEGQDQSSTAVRLVASGFLPDDDWETEFEAMTLGGQMYFETLVAYLDHFAGRFASSVNVVGPPVTDWAAAWAGMRAALGLGAQPAVGDPVQLTVPGLALLDGQVDFVNPQALGVRTTNGLYRFIQGFVGGFVLGHHLFPDPESTNPEFTNPDPHHASQAWKTWLAGI